MRTEAVVWEEAAKAVMEYSEREGSIAEQIAHEFRCRALAAVQRAPEEGEPSLPVVAAQTMTWLKEECERLQADLAAAREALRLLIDFYVADMGLPLPSEVESHPAVIAALGEKP